ncbi:MAG: hypothetical protein NTX50_12160 [Candidatus Sumerlaeota bacterium]|nr:hypothetical protein [Candidatus Sumerlaeota bacterium]
MFRFSLHPVLVVRKQAEDLAQRELAAAMKELARIQERIQGLENALALAGRDRRQMMETRFMPARQELYAAYARDVQRLNMPLMQGRKTPTSANATTILLYFNLPSIRQKER